MDKTMLLNDLRSTIEDFEKGSVSISFHVPIKNSGNVCAIQGPKKNLTVMLHYQNETEYAHEMNSMDDGDDISIKQEPNVDFMMNLQHKTMLLHGTTKLFNYEQNSISGFKKMLAVLKDLRRTIEFIVKDVVIISYHPQCQSEGNVWAIREPKRNVVVMLCYKDEAILAGKNDGIDNAIFIKHEPQDDFADDTECILPDIIETICQLPKDRTKQGDQLSGEQVDLVLNSVYSSAKNSMNDFRYAECESGSVHEMLVPEITIHDGFACDSNNEFTHDRNINPGMFWHGNDVQEMRSLFLQQPKSCVNSQHDISIVKQSVVHSQLWQLLNNDMSGTKNLSEIKVKNVCEHPTTNSVDSKNKVTLKKMEIIKLKNCSVLLERLNISSLKNPNLNIVLEQTLCPMNKKAEPNETNGLDNYKSDVKDHVQDYSFYRCSACLITFLSIDSYKMHICNELSGYSQCEKDLESNAAQNFTDNFYQCSLCDKKFHLKFTWKRHLRIHNTEMLYRCSQCDKTYSTKDYLDRHKLAHSREKRFECSLCKEKFSLKRELTRHRLVHRGEKPYECLQCTKKYTQKSALKVHMLVHSGEKPYECTQCNMKFSEKGVLTRHKQVHSGEKPFECLQCCKTFTRKEYLQLHLLTHTGEKPYDCLQCDKKFSTKNALDKHKLVHSGEKSFQCIYCSKAYFRKESLKQHLLTRCEEKLNNHLGNL